MLFKSILWGSVLLINISCFGQVNFEKYGLEFRFGFQDQPDSIKNEQNFELSIFAEEKSGVVFKKQFFIKIYNTQNDSLIRIDTVNLIKWKRAICGNNRPKIKKSELRKPPPGLLILYPYQTLTGSLTINRETSKHYGKAILLGSGEYKLTAEVILKRPIRKVIETLTFVVD